MAISDAFISKRFFNPHQQIFGDIHVSQLAGDLDVIHHARPHQGQFAVMRLGSIRHLLDTADQRGKTGDDDPAGSFAEDLIQRSVHHPFGGCPAGTFGIGGIRQQCQHAALGKLSQLGIVRWPIIHRGVVKFVIPRVHHQPGGCGDSQTRRHPGWNGIRGKIPP